jgi:hypothetical protein
LYYFGYRIKFYKLIIKGKDVLIIQMLFKYTKELLLSPETKVYESLTGHQELNSSYGIAPRILNDHLIYFINEGVIEGVISGIKTFLKPGMIMWLAPGVENTFKLAPGSNGQANLYHFRFQLSNRNITGIEKGYFLNEGMHDLEGLISMYYNEAMGMRPDRTHRMRNILSLILSDCCQHKRDSNGLENRLNSASYYKILNYSRKM